MERHIDYGGLKKKTNLSNAIKRAKEQGYRLSKKELKPGFKFLFYYDNSYYKVGLVHATYGIINNGGESILYHKGEVTSPLVISNEFGMCIIMPMKYDSDYYIKKNGNIVINLVDE